MAHIIIRADKGMWSLEEVLELLKKNNINYKLVDKTGVTSAKKKLNTGKLEKGGN